MKKVRLTKKHLNELKKMSNDERVNAYLNGDWTAVLNVDKVLKELF